MRKVRCGPFSNTKTVLTQIFFRTCLSYILINHSPLFWQKTCCLEPLFVSRVLLTKNLNRMWRVNEVKVTFHCENGGNKVSKCVRKAFNLRRLRESSRISALNQITHMCGKRWGNLLRHVIFLSYIRHFTTKNPSKTFVVVVVYDKQPHTRHD